MLLILYNHWHLIITLCTEWLWIKKETDTSKHLRLVIVSKKSRPESIIIFFSTPYSIIGTKVGIRVRSSYWSLLKVSLTIKNQNEQDVLEWDKRVISRALGRLFDWIITIKRSEKFRSNYSKTGKNAQLMINRKSLNAIHLPTCLVWWWMKCIRRTFQTETIGPNSHLVSQSQASKSSLISSIDKS